MYNLYYEKPIEKFNLDKEIPGSVIAHKFLREFKNKDMDEVDKYYNSLSERNRKTLCDYLFKKKRDNYTFINIKEIKDTLLNEDNTYDFYRDCFDYNTTTIWYSDIIDFLMKKDDFKKSFMKMTMIENLKQEN